MMRLVCTPTFLVLTLGATACGNDGTDDQGAICEPACMVYHGPEVPEAGVGGCVAGSCTPTFMACFDIAEFSTCQAQCEAAGSSCAENGCAGGTYMINSNIEECQDPTQEGVVIPRGCSEPIDWQFNTGARCCCEQNF